MNALEPGADQAVAYAIVDAEGRLLSADPTLDALNARAGGTTGTPLAVPQLATAARLARRLGITVSRGVLIADDYDPAGLVWPTVKSGVDAFLGATPVHMADMASQFEAGAWEELGRAAHRLAGLIAPPDLAARLLKLEQLCPGDFAAVKRQAEILATELAPEEFLEQLESEHRIKPEVREARSIGFVQ